MARKVIVEPVGLLMPFSSFTINFFEVWWSFESMVGLDSGRTLLEETERDERETSPVCREDRWCHVTRRSLRNACSVRKSFSSKCCHWCSCSLRNANVTRLLWLRTPPLLITMGTWLLSFGGLLFARTSYRIIFIVIKSSKNALKP